MFENKRKTEEKKNNNNSEMASKNIPLTQKWYTMEFDKILCHTYERKNAQPHTQTTRSGNKWHEKLHKNAQ